MVEWPEASYGAPARKKVTRVCVGERDSARAEIEGCRRPNPILEIPMKSCVEGVKLIQVGLVVVI